MSRESFFRVNQLGFNDDVANRDNNVLENQKKLLIDSSENLFDKSIVFGKRDAFSQFTCCTLNNANKEFFKLKFSGTEKASGELAIMPRTPNGHFSLKGDSGRIVFKKDIRNILA